MAGTEISRAVTNPLRCTGRLSPAYLAFAMPVRSSDNRSITPVNYVRHRWQFVGSKSRHLDRFDSPHGP